MVTFLVTLGFFLLVVAAMAVGVMLTGKKLKGSCGGVSGSACACGPKQRKECKTKGVPHADVPIDPSALARK